MGLSPARLQRQASSPRAGTWGHGDAPGVEAVVGAVVLAADPCPGTTDVDLGCGKRS
ncbi:MAG: hypothetical protein ACYDD4_11745 [Acidimicrobiales bacterium]